MEFILICKQIILHVLLLYASKVVAHLNLLTLSPSSNSNVVLIILCEVWSKAIMCLHMHDPFWMGHGWYVDLKFEKGQALIILYVVTYPGYNLILKGKKSQHKTKWFFFNSCNRYYISSYYLKHKEIYFILDCLI